MSLAVFLKHQLGHITQIGVFGYVLVLYSAPATSSYSSEFNSKRIKDRSAYLVVLFSF